MLIQNLSESVNVVLGEPFVILIFNRDIVSTNDVFILYSFIFAYIVLQW